MKRTPKHVTNEKHNVFTTDEANFKTLGFPGPLHILVTYSAILWCRFDKMSHTSYEAQPTLPGEKSTAS